MLPCNVWKQRLPPIWLLFPKCQVYKFCLWMHMHSSRDQSVDDKVVQQKTESGSWYSRSAHVLFSLHFLQGAIPWNLIFANVFQPNLVNAHYCMLIRILHHRNLRQLCLCFYTTCFTYIIQFYECSMFNMTLMKSCLPSVTLPCETEKNGLFHLQHSSQTKCEI